MGYKLGYHILVLPNQVLLINSVLTNEVLLYIYIIYILCIYIYIYIYIIFFFFFFFSLQQVTLKRKKLQLIINGGKNKNYCNHANTYNELKQKHYYTLQQPKIDVALEF